MFWVGHSQAGGVLRDWEYVERYLTGVNSFSSFIGFPLLEGN